MHGDLKPSNFFFAAEEGRGRGGEGNGGGDGGSGSDGDTAIDFQWAGWARGAADVAYVLACGVAFEALDEAALLGHYHAALARWLAPAPAPSRAQLQAAYEEELCALWTTAVPYLLAGLSPAICAANAAKHGWLTCEDDERVAAHFSARVLAIARAWRAEGRFPGG